MNYIPDYQLKYWSQEKIDEFNSMLALCYDTPFEQYVEKIQPVYRFINRKFNEETLSEIDDFLWLFDPTKASTVANIGMLRLTCKAREHLPNWFVCRAKVIAHFEERGQDWKMLLRGILNDK
jgi:hypothetical protein